MSSTAPAGVAVAALTGCGDRCDGVATRVVFNLNRRRSADRLRRPLRRDRRRRRPAGRDEVAALTGCGDRCDTTLVPEPTVKSTVAALTGCGDRCDAGLDVDETCVFLVAALTGCGDRCDVDEAGTVLGEVLRFVAALTGCGDRCDGGMLGIRT